MLVNSDIRVTRDYKMLILYLKNYNPRQVLGTLDKIAPSDKYFPFLKSLFNPQNNVGISSHHCMNRSQHFIGGWEGEVKTMFTFHQYREEYQDFFRRLLVLFICVFMW